MDPSEHVADAVEQATHRLSLRERKKIKTRETIRREAYRLFTAQGYDETTVDQIADAAEVSPSTFFRYFPTKEDVVLTDEYDPIFTALLRARPPDEPLIESVRHAMIGPVRELLAQDREALLTRLRLSAEVPALRARMWESGESTMGLMTEVLAERFGPGADPVALRVATAAIFAATQVAVTQWALDDGAGDLATFIDRAFDVLAGGLRL